MGPPAPRVGGCWGCVSAGGETNDSLRWRSGKREGGQTENLQIRR